LVWPKNYKSDQIVDYETHGLLVVEGNGELDTGVVISACRAVAVAVDTVRVADAVGAVKVWGVGIVTVWWRPRTGGTSSAGRAVRGDDGAECNV